MAVTIELPQTVEASLRQSLPNLDERAKEIILVTLYREGELTHFEFASAMGVTRYEADGILKRHRVTEDLMTFQDFEDERASLKRSPKE